MDLDAARYSFAENPAAAADSGKDIMSPSKARRRPPLAARRAAMPHARLP
jgi:hypothetical protein